MRDYQAFIQSKQLAPIISGFDVDAESLNANLFDFQRAIVKWALKRGRAAIFADTGLGKTLMQSVWAHEVHQHTGADVIIFAPLCVATQTVNEGVKFGIEINYCRDHDGVKPGINITNYEMMDKFDLSQFAGVVLDESSIIKNRDGKTRNAMIESCANVPYKLSCTATPSPNDFMELGNQVEFLGIMTMTEMLAMYFINDAGDTGTWILKGHGKAKFWEWMATWAVCIRSPADIGFDGSKYILPPLNMIGHTVESDATFGLFADVAQGLMERNQARRDSIDDRVAKCFSVVTSSFCDKLATSKLEGVDHGMETGVSGQQGCEGISESRNKGAQVAHGKGEPTKEQGSKKCVPERVCKKESGEIQTHTRTASELQQNTTREICERPNSSCEGTCESEGVSISETPSAESATNKIGLRNDNRTMEHDDGIAESSMCDMRILGYDKQAVLPVCRSLPQLGQSEGDTLCKLQLRGGELQGQHRTIEKGYSLSGKPSWVIWCHLNSEQDALEAVFGDDCFSIYGALSFEEKERRIAAWERGERPVLITKPSVCGFGMNWQHCNNTAFVGLSDSWEQYYQAIRRFYRFGQTHEVNVHVISAESEGAVVDNIRRKELQNHEMGTSMVNHMAASMKKEISGLEMQKSEYVRDVVKTAEYELHLADCVELASEIETGTVDYTIFSPPFESMYVFSNHIRDMGNSTKEQFYQHFKFLVDEMLRITRPGRLLSFHCMNLPTSKVNDGYIGIRDFRGDLIRLFQSAGWIYHSEVCIWKDPVVAMQRTKALGLLHKTIRKDSSMSRQGIADYLVTMRAPGVNDKPIHHYRDEKELHEVCKSEGLNADAESGSIFPVEMWQRYASPVWMDINQSRTLNFRAGREDDDQKHICPLQLDVIERAMTLWTAPHDLVFSPFTGIGSEGYVAVQMGRRFIGSELKKSYFDLAVKNMAEAPRKSVSLFDESE